MLTLERLKEVLDYDPLSGLFRWKVSLSIRTAVGSIAGCPDKDGYIVIRIDKILYKAHRLAWFYVHGVMPSSPIDHRNTVTNDNRVGNLRLASYVLNGGNRGKNQRNSTGFKGVTKNPRSSNYFAKIQKDGKPYYLGTFATAEEASIAYQNAAKQLYEEYARW